MTGHATTVNLWMAEPDSNNPSVIRWLSASVTGDWTLDGIKITAKWKSLGDGIGEVCTGRNAMAHPKRRKPYWELSRNDNDYRRNASEDRPS
jgi:hypothetical protein